MRRHRTLVLVLVTAALVAACTSPTAPAPQDQQITIGPHPNVVQGGR
ncbi:MAG TPA: hypothetical protein VIC55_00415 [Gemmatimonadaceae bacterium]|jgi:hypothetical protein